MQPELLCPRRSRFAPKYKLRLWLKAKSSLLKVEVGEKGVCKRASFGSNLSYNMGVVKNDKNLHLRL